MGIGGGPKKVRRPTCAHSPMDPRYLASTYHFEHFSAPFWAAITYSSHTQLIQVRKQCNVSLLVLSTLRTFKKPSRVVHLKS